MKKSFKLNNCNGVDITRTFSVTLRGYKSGANMIYNVCFFSNDIAPCLRTMSNFTLIFEPYEENNSL